jgi:hypothetical protein
MNVTAKKKCTCNEFEIKIDGKESGFELEKRTCTWSGGGYVMWAVYKQGMLVVETETKKEALERIAQGIELTGREKFHKPWRA